jgi:beta-fructofuranosidase
MTGSEDFHRPRFHYQPAKNWTNDPNGLIQWRGRIHMFYQYNPAGALSGRIHWGHAVSDDLLRWQELPVALSPLDEGPDAEGCWSGCAVDDGGTPTLVYTGVHPQVVCLATGPGDLAHFRQHPANPVIPGPPPELAEAAHGDFRDPYVWRAGDGWQMVIGTTLGPGGGAVLLYNSRDLVHWDYQGSLHQGNPGGPEPWNMNVWECANFVELGGQHVLFISAYRPELGIAYPVYYAGPFDGRTYSPRVNQPLTYGSTFYAPQAMRLADGRVVMWGWLRERRPDGGGAEITARHQSSLGGAEALGRRHRRDVTAGGRLPGGRGRVRTGAGGGLWPGVPARGRGNRRRGRNRRDPAGLRRRPGAT